MDEPRDVNDEHVTRGMKIHDKNKMKKGNTTASGIEHFRGRVIQKKT